MDLRPSFCMHFSYLHYELHAPHISSSVVNYTDDNPSKVQIWRSSSCSSPQLLSAFKVRISSSALCHQTSLMYALPIMSHKNNLPPVQNKRQNSSICWKPTSIYEVTFINNNFEVFTRVKTNVLCSLGYDAVECGSFVSLFRIKSSFLKIDAVRL